MSPLKAIRKYCLFCCTFQPKEVELCPVVNCPLWDRRFGKGYKKGNLKAIRARCLNCVGGSTSDVAKCDGNVIDGPCPLHSYRFGHRPNETAEDDGEE